METSYHHFKAILHIVTLSGAFRTWNSSAIFSDNSSERSTCSHGPWTTYGFSLDTKVPVTDGATIVTAEWDNIDLNVKCLPCITRPLQYQYYIIHRTLLLQLCCTNFNSIMTNFIANGNNEPASRLNVRCSPGKALILFSSETLASCCSQGDNLSVFTIGFTSSSSSESFLFSLYLSMLLSFVICTHLHTNNTCIRLEIEIEINQKKMKLKSNLVNFALINQIQSQSQSLIWYGHKAMVLNSNSWFY